MIVMSDETRKKVKGAKLRSALRENLKKRKAFAKKQASDDSQNNETPTLKLRSRELTKKD